MDKKAKAKFVIESLGGNKATAEFFCVTPGAVSQWAVSGLPPARELELFRRRSDVYWRAFNLGASKTAADAVLEVT